MEGGTLGATNAVQGAHLTFGLECSHDVNRGDTDGCGAETRIGAAVGRRDVRICARWECLVGTDAEGGVDPLIRVFVVESEWDEGGRWGYCWMRRSGGRWMCYG